MARSTSLACASRCASRRVFLIKSIGIGSITGKFARLVHRNVVLLKISCTSETCTGAEQRMGYDLNADNGRSGII